MGVPVSRDYIPDTWGWEQKGAEMEAHLSVTAGFWQPVSRHIQVHHRSLECAASEQDQEMAGFSSSLEKEFWVQKVSHLIFPGSLRGSGTHTC